MAVSIVQTPDGKEIRVHHPTGAAPEQIKQLAFDQLNAAGERSPLVDSASQRVVNNVLNAPRSGARLMQGILGKLPDVGSNLPPMLRVPAETVRMGLGAAANLPKVEGAGPVSSLESLMRRTSLGDDMPAETIQALRETNAQLSPDATGFGETMGDVASLVLARSPMNRGPGGLLDEGAEALRKGMTLDNAAPGIQGLYNAAIKSDSARLLFRGAGRAIETGGEGALLAALQDADPFETAMATSATQMASSGALQILSGAVGGGDMQSKLKRLGITAAVTAVGLNVLDQIIPGGEDDFIGDLNAGFTKAALFVALGAAGAAVGGARTSPGAISDNFPRIADAVVTVPRGAVVSAIAGMKDQSPEMRRLGRDALLAVAANPDQFSAEQRKQLDTALFEGGFVDTLKDLQSEKRFMEAIEQFRKQQTAMNTTTGGGF